MGSQENQSGSSEDTLKVENHSEDDGYSSSAKINQQAMSNMTPAVDDINRAKLLHAWRMRDMGYAPALANSIRMANLLAYHQVQKQYQEQLKLNLTARFQATHTPTCTIEEAKPTLMRSSQALTSGNSSRKYTRHPKPPYSYSSIIMLALLTEESRQLPLRKIIERWV